MKWKSTPHGTEILDRYSAITALLQFLLGVTQTQYWAQAIYCRGHKKISLNPHHLRPGSFPAHVLAWHKAVGPGWVAAHRKNPSLVEEKQWQWEGWAVCCMGGHGGWPAACFSHCLAEAWDVASCWESRWDVERLKSWAGLSSSQQPEPDSHLFPGNSKPPGIGHSLPCDNLLNTLQDTGPNFLRSGIRYCCWEQAGPVGSSAGVSWMCWCSTDTGAAARALPAEG